MFVIETDGAKAAKKMAIAMAIMFALHGGLGALLTLHVYVKPSPTVPPGSKPPETDLQRPFRLRSLWGG